MQELLHQNHILCIRILPWYLNSYVNKRICKRIEYLFQLCCIVALKLGGDCTVGLTFVIARLLSIFLTFEAVIRFLLSSCQIIFVLPSPWPVVLIVIFVA